MKFEKTIPVPATKRTVLDHYRCDLCDNIATDKDQWDAKSSFDKGEVTIQMEIGCIYPDGGNLDRTIFDICPTCFKTKLIPWFKDQGAEPRTENSEW